MEFFRNGIIAFLTILTFRCGFSEITSRFLEPFYLHNVLINRQISELSGVEIDGLATVERGIKAISKRQIIIIIQGVPKSCGNKTK